MDSLVIRFLLWGFVNICLAMGLLSCGPASVTEVYLSDMERFTGNPSNGFVQSRQIGDFDVQLKYLSPALLAIRESDSHPSKRSIDSLADEKRDGAVFTIKITHESISFHDLLKDDANRYNRLIGPFYQDLIISVGDTIFPCKIHHFEPDYGVSKSGVINAYFDRPNASKVTFIYSDQLFNLGPVKFDVPINKLDESFKLIYDEKT